MATDGSSTNLVVRPPYRDGFPGQGAVAIGTERSTTWPVVMIAVGALAAGANLVAGMPLIALGMVFFTVQGAYLLWQARQPQPPFVGPMGVDFGRWGVGWDGVDRYEDRFLYFDPPVDVGRRFATTDDLTRKVRLFRFDNDRSQVETALRRFRPELSGMRR